MSRSVQFLTKLVRVLFPNREQQQPVSRGPERSSASTMPFVNGEGAGRYGDFATVEVDPRKVGAVTLGYAPEHDNEPDPGEVVWTWVPYEERDGRGKDRPVIILAAGRNGAFLAAQLTSKNHGHQNDFVPLGSGPWDSAGRPSWANLERIFLVHTAGMRREAAALDRERYDLVADALRQRYGWK